MNNAEVKGKERVGLFDKTGKEISFQVPRAGSLGDEISELVKLKEGINVQLEELKKEIGVISESSSVFKDLVAELVSRFVDSQDDKVIACYQERLAHKEEITHIKFRIEAEEEELLEEEKRIREEQKTYKEANTPEKIKERGGCSYNMTQHFDVKMERKLKESKEELVEVEDRLFDVNETLLMITKVLNEAREIGNAAVRKVSKSEDDVRFEKMYPVYVNNRPTGGYFLLEEDSGKPKIVPVSEELRNRSLEVNSLLLNYSEVYDKIYAPVNGERPSNIEDSSNIVTDFLKSLTDAAHNTRLDKDMKKAVSNGRYNTAYNFAKYGALLSGLALVSYLAIPSIVAATGISTAAAGVAADATVGAGVAVNATVGAGVAVNATAAASHWLCSSAGSGLTAVGAGPTNLGVCSTVMPYLNLGNSMNWLCSSASAGLTAVGAGPTNLGVCSTIMPYLNLGNSMIAGSALSSYLLHQRQQKQLNSFVGLHDTPEDRAIRVRVDIALSEAKDLHDTDCIGSEDPINCDSHFVNKILFMQDKVFEKFGLKISARQIRGFLLKNEKPGTCENLMILTEEQSKYVGWLSSVPVDLVVKARENGWLKPEGDLGLKEVDGSYNMFGKQLNSVVAYNFALNCGRPMEKDHYANVFATPEKAMPVCSSVLDKENTTLDKEKDARSNPKPPSYFSRITSCLPGFLKRKPAESVEKGLGSDDDDELVGDRSNGFCPCPKITNVVTVPFSYIANSRPISYFRKSQPAENISENPKVKFEFYDINVGS